MSILSSILEKLGFGSAHASAQPAPDSSVAAPTAGGTPPASGAAPSAPTSEQLQAKLSELQSANSGLNPQTSIVDLLKALGLDSSFQHRQELAKEVGIQPYEGTAEQNEALHKAVLTKAAQG